MKTSGTTALGTWPTGDAGGYLRPGRFLDLGGKPHNNVLVTVAGALGVEVQTFGDPALCDGGPLAALRA